MAKYLGRSVLVIAILVLWGSAEIKADETSSTGYIGPTSSGSSQSNASASSNAPATPSAPTLQPTDTDSSQNAASSKAPSSSNSTDNKTSSTDSNKKTTNLTATAASLSIASPNDATSPASSAGVTTNVQAASVQVEPYSGSAGLSIPIKVPQGRAGIQPNLALTYSSSNRQLGNAGVGWSLDLGSIQISTKKGVPKYDGTDIFTMEQNGATQDLVADPNTPGLYHMEVEGAFANIQYFTTYWVITDKKGIKYYYGNFGSVTDCIQNNPANSTHIFRWALSRVEDLNGNYMTISYLSDNGQIYPNTIQYTGNDQQGLSPYATVTISYGEATQPSTSYISQFLVETALRINQITVSIGTAVPAQSTYNFAYSQSQDTGRDLLQSVIQTGSDGSSTLPAVTFTYSSVATNGSVTFNQANWNIPSGLQFATQNSNSTYISNGVQIADINGDGYPDLIKFNASDCGSGADPTNGVYLNNRQSGWVLDTSYPWPTGVFLADQCSYTLSGYSLPTNGAPAYDSYVLNKNDDLGVRLIDVDGDGRPDMLQSFSQVDTVNPSNIGNLVQSPYPASCSGSLLIDYLTEGSIFDPYNYVQLSYQQDTNEGLPLGPYTRGGCGFEEYDSSIRSILNSTLTITPPLCPIGIDKCTVPTGVPANANVFDLYLNQSSQFQSQNLSIPNNPVFSTESILQTSFTPPSRCIPNPGENCTSSFTDTLTTSLANITFADVNGDGYLDMVTPGAQPYINTKSQNPSQLGWQQLTSYSVPNVGNFSEGTMMIDLNGDGLSDMIQISASQGSFVYMNTGNGWVQDTSSPWLQGINTTNCDFATGNGTFIDVNGDGLPDLICTGGGSTTVYLNTGHGWSTSTTTWSLPGVNFTNSSTEFLDANADGLMDYMVYGSTTPSLYLNPASAPSDLLVGVNNGIGAQTSIIYNSALHYQNTYLPYYIPVVQSTTTTVGSQSYTTTYSYTGGLWDTNYREFDGFQTVRVTDPEGNYVTTTYDQDPTYVHWLKGNPLEQDTYDSNGNLYSKSVNTWGVQAIVTNTTSNQTSNFIYISRTDNYLYDGNSATTPKRTVQEFTYGENPQYGDVTQTINDGQVDPTAGTSIDPNKTITQITYTYNTNNWIIGLPAQTITQDVNGNMISETTFYYDNAPTYSTPPSLGQLTTKVNWAGIPGQPDPATHYQFDAYGNLHTTTDPNNNVTTITYDNTVHMFPEKTTNALNQNVTMTYYGIDSAPLNSGGLQGLWGQDRSKTDANNQTAYTTYDVFGRPSTSISPLDSIALPTEQKTYNIQPTYIAVTDTDRVTSGSMATISTVSYYDGLGRLIEKKSLGPTAGEYIASGQTVYDDRGLPVTKYLPHFTNNDLNTMDVIDTTVPASQATYDPMGRIITKTNPDGTYSSIAYDQWTTTTTDENGHMQQSTVDAFGRLVQKQEYAGADGRSPYYPAAPYTLYATTSYAYDPKGNLISVTDDHNNVTTITYDNLNRKIAMSDPDMGNWQYGYDSNGNLIWQQDAKGQVISFKYDALNRLINKTDAITGPIGNLPNITPHAATFNVNYNFDDPTQSFGIGRLGSVAYDTGTAGFIYDQLGREISSNKNVADGNYNVIRQYNALNQLQQLQYPDGSQVDYVYNQAGQVSGVADAGAVGNGVISGLALNNEKSNEQLAWLDKVLGVNNAYAATASSPAVTITSPANNSTFTAGTNLTITASASEHGGSIARVSFYYNGTNLLGTSTTSPYKYTITNLPVGNFSLTAKATDTHGVSTTSSSVNIRVNSALPVVAITSPTNGSTFVAGSNLTIAATASEVNGSIASVSFYYNYNGTNILAGTSTTPPYSYTAYGIDADTFILTAVATDTNGVSTTSSPITITVTASSVPTITTQPASVTVTAPATATFSVVTTGTPAPTYQWMQEVVGAGSFTAISGATNASYTTSATTTSNSGTQYECVVTDSAGSVTSNAATLTVNIPAPTVSLSANSSTYAVPATVILTATAAQQFGTISRVDFYNGSTLLGSSSSDPFTYTWSNVPAGSYSLTANAYNNNGVETSSNAISISVVAPNVYIQSINYNANGQITQIQYGNGTVTAYTYDPLMFRLTRIYTSNAQATVIQDLNYTYDSVGQVLTIKDNVNTGSNSMTQTFAYDALNRLVSALGTYGTKTYAYDSIGNITLKDGLTYNYAEANSRINGTAAGPHAVTSLSDGSIFKYDANGNMVSLQKGSNLTQYAYDSQNRLQTVTVGGLTIASYVYDGDGGRTQKTVYRRDLALYNDNTNPLLFGSISNPLPATAQNPSTDTTLDVGNVYESEVATGLSRNTKFIYLGDTRVASVGSDGNVFYYHDDHLGDTNVLTDQTGSIREFTDYDPFGQVINHDKYGNNFATAWYYFTGKPLDDETGLIFLGSRYYNPSLGRFITPDTVVQAPSNPQTLNRYTYCNNNPVNNIDPTGHSWFSSLFKAIGKFFENLVKNPVQTILSAIAVLVAIVIPTPASPFIIASAELSLFNTGTSSYTGGAWNTFHQIVGYASLALAVVGAYQSFTQVAPGAASAAGQTGGTAGSTSGAAVSLPGDVSPDFSPLQSPDDLTSVINNVSSNVFQQASATNALVGGANNAGGALSNVIRTTVIGPTPNWENQFLNGAFGNTYALKNGEILAQLTFKASLTVVSVGTGGVAPTLFAFGSDMIGEADWNLAIYTQSTTSGQSIAQIAKSVEDAKDTYDNIGSATDLASSL